MPSILSLKCDCFRMEDGAINQLGSDQIKMQPGDTWTASLNESQSKNMVLPPKQKSTLKIQVLAVFCTCFWESDFDKVFWVWRGGYYRHTTQYTRKLLQNSNPKIPNSKHSPTTIIKVPYSAKIQKSQNPKTPSLPQ